MELYLNAEKTTRIFAEEGNFTLQTQHVRQGGKHAGEPYWKFRGHYSRLEGALAACIINASVRLPEDQRTLTKGADITRVRALIVTITNAHTKLEEAAGDFMPAGEAHVYEGSVYGVKGKMLDNPWSKT